MIIGVEPGEPGATCCGCGELHPVEEERMIDHHVVEVWTDGSGTTAGNPGGWAYVMTTVHPTTAEVFERCESGFVSDATNNRAEMLALLMALQAIEAPAFVTVHTDSGNLISGWARRCSHRVNADLWQALLVAAEPHTLTWEKVEGHTGVELNEECDKLAGIARRAAIALRQEDVPSGQSPGEVSTPRPPSPFQVAMAGPDSALCAFLLAAVTISDASWSARASGATREPGELRAAFIRRVLG
jgi:ribonuclease HI